MSARLRLAFDLDGTLFDAGAEIDYDDPESVARHTRPHREACELVHIAAANGHRVSYHTGRSEPVRAVTWQQIVRWLPVGPLHMSPSWRGYAAMAQDRAASFRLVSADLAVGDKPADADAAALAGVAFLHADHWRAGTLPQHIAPIVHRGHLVGFQRADTLLKEGT